MKKKFSIILLMFTIFISKTNLQAMDMDLEEPTEQFIIMPLAHKKARQWYYQNRAHDLADHEKKQLCDTLAEAAKENYRSDGFNPRVYRIISECDLDQPTQIPR